MTKAISVTTQNASRSARVWKFAAFASGMIFTAALAQFIAIPNADATGKEYETIPYKEESPAPAIQPDQNYAEGMEEYRLAKTSPEVTRLQG